jgi:hypothetical protein
MVRTSPSCTTARVTSSSGLRRSCRERSSKLANRWPSTDTMRSPSSMPAFSAGLRSVRAPTVQLSESGCGIPKPTSTTKIRTRAMRKCMVDPAMATDSRRQ